MENSVNQSRIKRFENILDERINSIPENRFMSLEFTLFNNDELGGEAFEFMSMIVTYLNEQRESDFLLPQECYDICKETDSSTYDECIALAEKKTVKNSRILIVDNR